MEKCLWQPDFPLTQGGMGDRLTISEHLFETGTGADMNLFDVIPTNFFNLLSSQSSGSVYSGALLTIYEEYEHEISYRIPREQIRDAVAVYLLDNHIRIEDADSGPSAAAEDGRRGPEADRSGASDPVRRRKTGRARIREDAGGQGMGSVKAAEGADSMPASGSGEEASAGDMASAILRKLSAPEVGWLSDEIDDMTYGHNIVMTEQGIRLAEFLEQLMKPERAEFSSYIFDIYNRLENEAQWRDNPYVNALKAVFRNARALSHALKQLSTFIRDIIARMTKEESMESLTDNILSYLGGDFIREYARLNKQQNIHIYRTVIIGKLQEMESSGAVMQKMVRGCMEEEKLQQDEARDRIADYFQLTKKFLREDYDRIMHEIQHKITVYLQIAVGRARFLQNRDPNTRGYVEQALKYLIEGTEQMGMKDLVPDDVQNLFSIETYDFINLSSLRYPGRVRQIRKSEETEYYRMTEEEMDEAMQRQREAAYNPYSRKAMKQYLDDCMHGADAITSDELPMGKKEEMLAALSAAAFGRENGFAIEPLEGYRDSGNLRLRRFLVRREEE